MKEDAEDVLTLVSSKLPGKTIIWTTFGVFILIIFVLGFGIGFGSRPASQGSVPVFYFVSPHNESCPALTGERLLTTLRQGDSFEGLSLRLQCRGNYLPFPASVRCERKAEFDNRFTLQWSGLPVCYPASLMSVSHWKQTLHAKSVVCQGDKEKTTCQLQCILDYVPVEEEQYRCTSLPCKAWTISDKKCYRCDRRCQQWGQLRTPAARDLLAQLSCDSGCDRLLVTSSGGAAVWQNKRTGLFNFIGEHSGRPLYQKNSTLEFLYYVNGTEWLIGPDFKKAHGGIQLFNNDDSQCPERHGGTNHTKVYIDSSQPLLGNSNIWREDSSLEVKCYDESSTSVAKCACTEYQVEYDSSDSAAPEAVQYYTASFKKLEPPPYDFLAPVYYDQVKELYLFSHHPAGLLWQISPSFVTTPVRAISKTGPQCPDSREVKWEWYNSTTELGQQIYVQDDHIKIVCKW